MKKTFLLLTLLSLTLIGCGKETETNNENQKQIVASFYPLAFMAEEIGGKKVAVTNLAGSVSPHTYQLTPQDLVKLNNADLVLVQGAKLEPWSEDIVQELNQKSVNTLELSEHLELYEFEDHEEHEDEHHEDDEHEEEHEDEAHEEEGHDEHDHGKFDPHTWLSPVLASDMVDTIMQSMIEIDPENKTTYETNAQNLKSKFVALDTKFQTTLQNCTQNEVIISHDAYGYLARAYGFETHAIAGLSITDEPSAQILAELKEEAEEGMTHILVEKNSVKKFADTLANETGLGTLNVNPMGRGTLDPNKDFFDVMENNLESFSIALNCEA